MILSSTIITQRLAERIFKHVMKTFDHDIKKEIKKKYRIVPKIVITPPSIVEQNQSQRHGFVFENRIRKVFRVFAEGNNTDIHDIPKIKNALNPNENVSIKLTGRNDISCGDIMRFYDYNFSDENTIIVGQYKQTTNKNITRIIELSYDQKMHDILFGTVTRETLIEYVELVKSIPRGYVTTKRRHEIIQRKKDIEKDHGMFIQISPKIDNNNQRRVQCRIKNIDELIKIIPTALKSESTDGFVRGVKIDLEIISAPRIRYNTRNTTISTS